MDFESPSSADYPMMGGSERSGMVVAWELHAKIARQANPTKS
ncbi:hypothetical protein SAMN05444166_2883 [Singulisphaera sp. GP187]|nr:hypothetical protein SAMN05444166_2883 [Singulisphaera sp. GP187]